MDIWPPKNGESSTTPPSVVNNSGQTTSERPSNRVIMLLGLDPNTTSGLISKAFSDHGLQVTVDYQRDDTIGYVQLHLDIAKEVAERIMSNGGLRIGTDVAVLRALEGMEDLMYWSVYAGARIVPARLLGNCKTSGKVRYQRRNNRQNPYQIVELDDSTDASPKHPRQNHINHIAHCRSSRPAKSSKAKKKKRKAEKALLKTASKRVKATKKRLSFIEADDQTASDVIFRINETNGTLTSPARDPAYASIEIRDIDSTNNIHWMESKYPSKIKIKPNILSSPSAILPFGTYQTYPASVLTEKSGISRDKPSLSFESSIKESPLIASMSEDSPDSVKSETSLIPYTMSKTSAYPRFIDLLNIGNNTLLASSELIEEMNLSNDDTLNTIQHLQSPLFQEVCLKNKDDADEVEEKLKNLRLNAAILEQ